MTIAAQLDQAFRNAGLNIVGARLDNEADPATWQAVFATKPSAADLATAQAVIAAFDVKAAQAADAAPPVTTDVLTKLLLQKGVITQADLAPQALVLLQAKK